VLRDPDGTLVFVEVRTRRGRERRRHPGATAANARLVYAAQHYLLR
jgi:Holliday junction resolvase-like predicted endonuclease